MSAESSARYCLARAIMIASIVLLAAGCVTEESDHVHKIGRYEFHSEPQGLEIRESSTGLSRLLDALFGRTSQVKLRLGAWLPEQDALSPSQVADVLVRKRKLKGPATKPNAMKRPFEVRLAGAGGDLLAPFFYFRFEREAESFAAALREALSASLLDTGPVRDG